MAFLVSRAGCPGMTYKQTHRRELRRVTRGVRAVSDDWWERVRAYSLVMPPGAVFSHVTAAVIQDLNLPPDPPRELLHITTPAPGPRVRRKGMTAHSRPLPVRDVERWHGVLVTSPARTVRDLADLLDRDALIVMADELLRTGLCGQADLLPQPGQRHAQMLRTVSRLADAGSASPEETRLRLQLHDAGLPPPTLNEDIIEDGLWIGRGDLVWRPWRTIADYDGDHHKTTAQRHQDSQTRDDYTAEGWRHIAITKKMKKQDRIDRVTRALRENGWR